MRFSFCCLLSILSCSILDAQNPSARWEPAIKKFEEQDAAQSPAKGGVLFVGSSSIRLWDLGKSFPGKEYLNRGFGGSQIADSIHYIDQLVLKHEPSVVLMYAGDNDVAAGKSSEIVASDFVKFTKLVHEKLPSTEIMYIAIKPSIKRWDMYSRMADANNRIAAYCQRDSRLTYLDIATPMIGQDGKPRPELFAKDGLHLNNAGYEVWTEVVEKSLLAKCD